MSSEQLAMRNQEIKVNGVVALHPTPGLGNGGEEHVSANSKCCPSIQALKSQHLRKAYPVLEGERAPVALMCELTEATAETLSGDA